MSSETVYLLIPEIILVFAATAIYLGGTFMRSREGWSWLAAAALLVAGLALYQQHSSPILEPAANSTARVVFSGPLTLDAFSQAVRWTVLAVGLLFVMLSSRAATWSQAPEFMGSLLLILAGLMLVATANDLVLLFLALELVSIPTYVVLYLGRSDAASQEATAKYFFLSILSSALLLYGFSFLYGAAGSAQLGEVWKALSTPGADPAASVSLARLALVLIVAGLGFRIAAVPFHFYAPDVFQGTSHPNAGLLSVVPKVAGFAALLRIVAGAMPGLEGEAWQMSMVLAMLTMTVGNVLALWQQNIRRMLAYSSIAHAGYMLIGLAVGFAVAGDAQSASSINGFGAMLFYLLVYAAATIGTFAALALLSSEDRAVDGVDDLAGLGLTHPRTAAAISVFMFSLTGLPPLAGFFGKLTLFTDALAVDAAHADAVGQYEAGPLWSWFLALAIVGVLNAAISAGYYLRIVGAMYFRSSINVPDARGGWGAAAATLVCALLVIGAGLWPSPLIDQANRAGEAVTATFGKPDVQQPALGSAPGPNSGTARR